MLSLLLSVLLTLSPADSTADLEKCLSLGPEQNPPPVESLNQAQQTWLDGSSIPRDTLQRRLSQILEARDCFLDLRPAQTTRPYLDNLLRTYEVEAELRVALREFREAFSAYEAGLSLFRSQSPADFPKYAAARSTWPRRYHLHQGYLHYLLGNLSASIESYLQALEAASTPADQIELLVGLGVLHQRAQDYPSANHYYQRAQQRLQDSSLTPESRRNLQAYAAQAQSDLLLEQTLNTEFATGPLKRARDVARRGRALAEPGTERHARLSSLLSESLGYLGTFDEAYRLNDQVRRYAQTHENARLSTFALFKRGVLHVQTERWAAADSTFRTALAQAEALGDLDYQRRILRDLGRLYELQGRWAEAESAYRKGVGVIEEYRESLSASQWSTTAFAQWRDVHRGLARTLLAQDRPRAALAALDRSRARHLQDLRTRARVSNQLPPEERARLDSLTQALTEVRNRLGEPSLTDSAEAALRNSEAGLIAARQQLLQLDQTASRPSIEEISEALKRQDRALVSYFLDDPWPVYDRPPRSAAFVLTGDSLRTVSLPGLTQDSVQAHVNSISPLFTSRAKPDRANAMHFDLRPLHRLHDAVYAPVAQHLPGDRSLTVIPDGPLFHLPFSTLVHSMPGGRYAASEARYVLHDRPTSLELASSMVADTTRWRVEWSRFEPEMAAYGVSDFDTLRSVPPSLRTAIPEALSDSSLALPSLPGVRQEVRALQSTIPGVRTALDEQVSEAAFCRSARTAGVLHVASHAFVNASSPLRNAILLRPQRREAREPGSRLDSSDQAAGPDDGILFLHELQGQQARIPMVVLSGCSTASGTLRGGEGMEGLQYAFRAMGAQSTVSTLWPVADQASVTLMDAFYAHLQDGHSKDAALRQAQLDFLASNPQKASPFFWAPPVLYGSPAPLPLEAPLLPTWAWWGLGLAGLVLAFLLGRWFWATAVRPSQTASSR